MSEEKAVYEVKEGYIKDALEMLGKGYDNPSVEIEQERVVIERRNGELKEVVKPAFIKISTSFKSELITMSDAALKVWVFISLSVNRNTGTANPGLRTIAKALGKGVNTIQECLTELENLNLLTVDRNKRKYNIYEPTAYVSANRLDPVSAVDTDSQTVSSGSKTVSENIQTVSNREILNQINQSEPNCANAQNSLKTDELPIDWQIGQGREKITIPDSDTAQRKDAAMLIATGLGVRANDAYELAFAFQDERKITFTNEQVKGQRKAVKFLLEKKITPEQVREAVRKLIEISYPCTDLHSILKTADGIANPAPTNKSAPAERNPLGI